MTLICYVIKSYHIYPNFDSNYTPKHPVTWESLNKTKPSINLFLFNSK